MISTAAPAQPGSAPLPNPGQPGTAYAQLAMKPGMGGAPHPASVVQPRQNPMNAGAPAMAPVAK